MTTFHEDARSFLQELPYIDDKQQSIERLRGWVTRSASEGREAWRLYFDGRLALQEDRLDDAIRVYDELLSKYGTSTLADDQELVARALMNKGFALGKKLKPDEAVAVCDEVLRRFGDATGHSLREQVASALLNKGVALAQKEKPDEAIAVWDDVLRRFGDATETVLRERVAKAMLGRGWALEELKRTLEAIGVYDDLIAKHADATNPLLRELVDTAKAWKAVLLSRNDDPRASEAKRAAVDATKGKPSNLRTYLTLTLAHVDKATREEYFQRIKASKEKTRRFLTEDSNFGPEDSFLLVLREWNSFTPTVPSETEADRGGGYYLRHGGEGIVIDPGYDFIQNFHQAGGRICDINHIIVTHAHDDHTAELEAILMLLHQANRERMKLNKPLRRVSLCLSQGCERKFSGIIPTREDSRIDRHITLSCPGPGCSQHIRVSDKIVLTVLPAYHDDVVTHDTAVGLGFEFLLEKGERRHVVFTSDTGCYPFRFGAEGEPLQHSDPEKRPKLDTSDAKGIYNQYPSEFQKPDLFVAHIGSILENEFDPIELLQTDAERQEDSWYYPNHLGMLGTLTVLDKLSPKNAIVSEFGAELKGFHLELVERIAEALRDKQTADGVEQPTFVVPGDLTMVYYIADDKFLCHSDNSRQTTADLVCERADDWEAKAALTKAVPDMTRLGESRAYLFAKGTSQVGREEGAFTFSKNRFMHRLPHHREST